MNINERKEKLAFIFETGRALRFQMDYLVSLEMPDVDPVCSDLSPIQMRAAMQVWLHQPLSLGALARRLQMSPSAASTLVDKLVEHGVFTRTPDPADRRRVQIHIHPDAAATMNAYNQRFHAAFSTIAGKVTDDRVDHWYQAMTQIREILEAETPTYENPS